METPWPRGALERVMQEKMAYFRRFWVKEPPCEGVVVPEGGREGTQGYQLRLETAPVLLYRFLIIGVKL